VLADGSVGVWKELEGVCTAQRLFDRVFKLREGVKSGDEEVSHL
jgi:hypothetical protein